MNNEQAYRKLYTIANSFAGDLMADGEITINAHTEFAEELCAVLWEIDRGVPDDNAHGYVEIETKYMGEKVVTTAENNK